MFVFVYPFSETGASHAFFFFDEPSLVHIPNELSFMGRGYGWTCVQNRK